MQRMAWQMMHSLRTEVVVYRHIFEEYTIFISFLRRRMNAPLFVFSVLKSKSCNAATGCVPGILCGWFCRPALGCISRQKPHILHSGPYCANLSAIRKVLPGGRVVRQSGRSAWQKLKVQVTSFPNLCAAWARRGACTKHTFADQRSKTELFDTLSVAFSIQESWAQPVHSL